MTEKKTFKHPLGLTSAFGEVNQLMRTAQTPKYEIYTEESGYEEFPLDAWDIEVTFTKKVKPLAVGDVVRFDSWDRVYSVTILAIDDDTYWVRTDSGDYHTLGADDLDR
jgi:hypothetical protein